MEEKKPLSSIHKELMDFINSFESTVLATVNKTSTPESSYAPVLQYNHRYYVYVSELSNHTQNLMDVPKASLLFIEPEQEAKHLFARKRASLKVNANHLSRDSDTWNEILEKMEAKFGEIIQMLRPLEDFHLFELSVAEGNYVRGFAQAYKLGGEDLSDISHINDRGHGKSHRKD